MTSQPSPVYVARAIADALTEQARAAHRYHEDWSRLAWAHMPVEHIRAVLDCEAADLEADALVKLRAWNQRRLWCCGGTVGAGKTFAAATWGLAWIRSGRTLHWVSAAAWATLDLEQQRVLLRAATQADGLVIDDVGAGLTQGPGFRQRVEGMVIERGDRPTIVLGNLNASEVNAWIGPRLVSRMGRPVAYVESRDRRRGSDAPAHECKVCKGVCSRSPRWHDAAEILDVIGVREDSRWYAEAGKMAPWLAVGHKIEHASRIPGALREARRRFGLDQTEIVAAARELEAVTERLGGVLAARVAHLAVSKRADNLARAKTCYDARSEIEARPRGEPAPSTMRLRAGLWPEHGDDTNTKLRDLGFRVRARAGRFEVRKMLLDEHGKPAKRDKGDLGQLMLDGDGDASAGWSAANRLAAL